MATKVGEMFVELVVDAASGNLSVRQLVGALGELDVASAASVGILGKVADTIWGMASAATGAAVELSNLSAVTGLNPKMIDQWDKAAEAITGHAGTITQAIKTVQAMNQTMASTKRIPGEITGYLQTTPYKYGPGGEYLGQKQLPDYLKEFAQPGSGYGRLDKTLQMSTLNLFGNGQELWRVIESLKAGTFNPSAIPTTSAKQDKDLASVNSEWIKVKQDIIGIFDKFLLAGDRLSAILKYADEILKRISFGMDTPKVQNAINEAAKKTFGHPLMDMIHEKYPALGRSALPPVRLPAAGAAAQGDSKITVNSNISLNGDLVDKKTSIAKRGVTTDDFTVWSDTANAGGGAVRP